MSSGKWRPFCLGLNVLIWAILSAGVNGLHFTSFYFTFLYLTLPLDQMVKINGTSATLRVSFELESNQYKANIDWVVLVVARHNMLTDTSVALFASID